MQNWKIAAACVACALLGACKSAPPTAAAPPVEPPPIVAASEPQPAAAAQPAAAPAVTPAMSASVSGKVTYLIRMALPPQARVKVQLLESAAAGAPAKSISEQTIETKGRQVPFAYKLAYDPKAISPKSRYQVSAVITVNDEVWFTTDKAPRVITGGNPKQRDIVVTQVKRP